MMHATGAELATWTTDDANRLRHLREQGKTYPECAVALGRSYHAVKRYAQRLKLPLPVRSYERDPTRDPASAVYYYVVHVRKVCAPQASAVAEIIGEHPSGYPAYLRANKPSSPGASKIASWMERLRVALDDSSLEMVQRETGWFVEGGIGDAAESADAGAQGGAKRGGFRLPYTLPRMKT